MVPQLDDITIRNGRETPPPRGTNVRINQRPINTKQQTNPTQQQREKQQRVITRQDQEIPKKY
jgi:hypothetical protein